MHIAFDGLIGSIILIYLDDLVVFSKNKSDQFAHLRAIFIHCHKYWISLNPSKSIFGVETGKILGNIVSSLGKEIQNISPPKSKKDIQVFMGYFFLLEGLYPTLLKLSNLSIIC